MKDYYQILQVPAGASLDEIKRAYRRLAMLYHPSRNPSARAARLFQEVQEAYEALSDDDLRQAFEEWRKQPREPEHYAPLPPDWEEEEPLPAPPPSAPEETTPSYGPRYAVSPGGPDYSPRYEYPKWIKVLDKGVSKLFYITSMGCIIVVVIPLIGSILLARSIKMADTDPVPLIAGAAFLLFSLISGYRQSRKTKGR